ncbi:hypothetical protein Scep_014533 [Stephania cephalantha]|uniref:RNase H type-1 domain-containing protein n=1 Tax=Stephania cephalantha TaxID=152367 RepID=A0AAP0J3H9_9MAGN
MQSRPIQSWLPPSRGMMKLNVDAPIDSHKDFVGVGGVFRDHEGVVHKAFATKLEGFFSPKIAEFLAIKEGVRFAVANNIHVKKIESDASTVVASLRNHIITGFSGGVVEEIEDLLLKDVQQLIFHIPRSGNSVAHVNANNVRVSEKMRRIYSILGLVEIHETQGVPEAVIAMHHLRVLGQNNLGCSLGRIRSPDLTEVGACLLHYATSMAAEGIITEGSSIIHHGGAKIKRSSAKQSKLHKPSCDHMSNLKYMKETNNSVESLRYDSSPAILNPFRKENFSKYKNGLFGKNHSQSMEEVANGHAMQSIFLGYDRRFNRYWLLLGPCDVKDPGLRRIYFESSEDGHWEVIDTEEVTMDSAGESALCALLSVLDVRGAREAFLLSSLKKRDMFLRQATSNKVGMDDEMRQLTGQSEQSSINMSSCDGSPVSAVDNNSTLSDASKDQLVSTGETTLDAGRRGRHEK